MLIYYDLVADKEIASDAYDEVNPVPGIKGLVSKRITVKEGEVDIGANASAEAQEDDEGVDEAEEQTVINIVYSSKLQKIELDKKEFKTLMKAYFKKLLETYNTQKYKLLGFDNDYTPPADKAEAKAAEDEAVSQLGKFDKAPYEALVKTMGNFKKNFEGVNKFINDEILGNWDECEFYTCDEGELGECMIIPARYVGESVAPVFYLYTDGIKEKKA